MIDLEMEKLNLARAERHLQAAEMGVTLQRQTIAKLEAQGRPTHDARRALARLEEVVSTMRAFSSQVQASMRGAGSEARDLPLAAPPWRSPIHPTSPSAAATGLHS
jgi:hypothetical protein